MARRGGPAAALARELAKQEVLSTPKQFAHEIKEAWQKSLDSVIETGRLLIKAKADLEHGEFEAMIERDLPFSASTARRLMIVAADLRSQIVPMGTLCRHHGGRFMS